MEYIHEYESPLGPLTLAGDGRSLTGLWLAGQKYYEATLGADVEPRRLPLFDRVGEWLDVYFRGEDPGWLPPLAPKGSGFRQAVWKILLGIPFGKTVTYGEIAARVGRLPGRSPTSARAVGGAVGHNPVSIIIPCHRVIGSDGSLTGYAGGVDKKIRLLQLEKAEVQRVISF